MDILEKAAAAGRQITLQHAAAAFVADPSADSAMDYAIRVMAAFVLDQIDAKAAREALERVKAFGLDSLRENLGPAAAKLAEEMPGIPREILEAVADAFEQGHASTVIRVGPDGVAQVIKTQGDAVGKPVGNA